MKKWSGCRKGSALLLAVIFTMLLLGLIQPFLRTSSLLLDLAIVRLRESQQRWATQALAQWGVDIVHHRWQTIMQAQQARILQFDRWPISNEQTIKGTLTIEPLVDNTVRIAAKTGFDQADTVLVAQAIVAQITSDSGKISYQLDGWSVGREPVIKPAPKKKKTL